MSNEHTLERNTDEAEYFVRLNKNGKAAYRRAVVTLSGSYPSWAAPLRKGFAKVVTQFPDKVVTLPTGEVVTLSDSKVVTQSDPTPVTTLAEKLAKLTRRRQTAEQSAPAVDPLTLL